MICIISFGEYGTRCRYLASLDMTVSALSFRVLARNLQRK